MSEINFVTVDTQTIINDLINDFETYTGDVLYPGDARRIFLQGFAYVLVDIYNSINTAGRSNLLRYAFDETLDALGDYYGVPRLEEHYSTVIMRFNLSNAQTQDVTVAAGTRVTPDGKLFFATDTDLIISAGSLYGDIEATATASGTIYNNFIAGQINKIVDGNAYVVSVTNTGTSSGGTDAETDDEYRERIRVAPYSYSTAGPTQSYYYWAKNASSNVEDANSVSPSAGTMAIYVLKKGGVIPNADDQIISDVISACTSKTRRPTTDNVSVLPAVAVNTTINVEYYISSDDSTNVSTIQEAVTDAVNEYKTWQITKIKRTISPDKLRKLMQTAGASRVVVTSPVRTELTDSQVAQITSVTVTYKGLGD